MPSASDPFASDPSASSVCPVPPTPTSPEATAASQRLSDAAAALKEALATPAAAAIPVPTHSQNNEESVVAAWFQSHPPKFGRRLLDIGAWDGVTMSNSRALVEADWNAVLVEAAAGPFTRLMQHCRGRNMVRLVQAFVIGSRTKVHHSGLTVLQHTNDAVSTSDPEVYEAWKTVVKDYFPVMVPTVAVSRLLEAFPGPFDFVTLDTEGETFSIFCDLIEQAEISCLVVEHSCGGISVADQMRSLALSRGFTEIGVNGENIIFGKHPPA